MIFRCGHELCTRDIDDDLQFRSDIIEWMHQENTLEYHEGNDAIDSFQRDGVEGLSFHIIRLRRSPDDRSAPDGLGVVAFTAD